MEKIEPKYDSENKGHYTMHVSMLYPVQEITVQMSADQK